jgi:uncharacterized repeat protein (TIGR03943 family)
MTWDWTRIVRGVALAAWGGFFVYLWVSGRATTYIGPKTSWVVTLGAITLPLVAIAYLWGARGTRRSASLRELGGNGLLIAPILLALMVPAPSLGALAVKNKRVKNPPPPVAAPVDGEIRLYEIAWAGDSAEFAEMNRITTGTAVDFVGFVSAKLPRGELELSRFSVNCCAADGTAFSVTIKPPADAADFAVDDWVSVKGKLVGTPGKGLKVAATNLTRVSEPANPYG